MPSWSTEQILGFSQDANATRSARELAAAARWQQLGCNERAVWGSCRGSAKEPYRTTIDLSEPAFRCSCPSRKIPCKHSLALFLLFDSDPSAFSTGVPPQHVSEWINSRDERTQRVQERARPPKTPDPDAQAKTAAKRLAKVETGLKEIELWISDLVRGGLASAQSRGYAFWDNAAARMVDAQAPGVARLIRNMAGIASSGHGWEGRLFERLCRLHLLLEGFKNIEQLDPPTQADVRSLIGWTQSQEELLLADGIRDEWQILGQRVEEDDRFRVQRTWMFGRKTCRRALILQFSTGNRQPDITFTAGTRVDCELVFFPGAFPLRALMKERYSGTDQIESLPGFNLESEIGSFADALAVNPWIERFPIAISSAVPFLSDGRWYVRDEADFVVPLAAGYQGGWHLLSLSGGRPVSLFGEWDGEVLLPLSVFADGRFVVPLVDYVFQ